MLINDEFTLDFMYLIVTLFIGIFTIVLGILTIRNNCRLDTERRKTETTLAFIEEFYSEEFMFHRKALWNLHKKAMFNIISIEDMAKKFVYSGDYDSRFISDITSTEDILKEHNHLTMYLSFLQRLAISIDKDQVYVELIKEAISDAMIWHAELSLKVCYAIKGLADDQLSKYKKKVKDTGIIENKGMQGRVNLIVNPAQMVIDLHEKLDLSLDKLENEIKSYD